MAFKNEKYFTRYETAYQRAEQGIHECKMRMNRKQPYPSNLFNRIGEQFKLHFPKVSFTVVNLLGRMDLQTRLRNYKTDKAIASIMLVGLAAPSPELTGRVKRVLNLDNAQMINMKAEYDMAFEEAQSGFKSRLGKDLDDKFESALKEIETPVTHIEMAVKKRIQVKVRSEEDAESSKILKENYT